MKTQHIAAFALSMSVAACGGKMILSEQAEARRLGASLHVNFVKANEAANRAVMSTADDASAAAARDATTATESAQRDLERLEPLVQSLGYKDEIAILEQFKTRFAEFRQLDADVLPLAVENTNLKAHQLATGEAQTAADAMAAALDRVAATGGKAGEIENARLAARNGLLEIQVVQGRHIAEADDAAMTRMEGQMNGAEQRARTALEHLSALAPKSPDVAAARAAFDRFLELHQEIVRLSRLNTNVRSLAVTLGRKRVVAAECESQLRALDDALTAHTFKATK